VSFGPVVTSSSLAEDEVIGSKQLTERSSSDWVHGSWLEVHEDSSWDVSSSSGLIIVHIDPLKLEIWVSVICTSRVYAVLVWDDLPELGSYLVTALTGLNVNDFSHNCYDNKKNYLKKNYGRNINSKPR
jgi:hypothetical protein